MDGLWMAYGWRQLCNFFCIAAEKHTCMKGLIDSLDLERSCSLSPCLTLSEAKAFALAQDAERMREIDQVHDTLCCLCSSFLVFLLFVPPTFLIRQRIDICFRVTFAFELTKYQLSRLDLPVVTNLERCFGQRMQVKEGSASLCLESVGIQLCYHAARLTWTTGSWIFRGKRT